jgi:peroxiredoxin Q/BCP
MTAYLKAGDQAPDFDLPTGVDSSFRLSAHKGSKVVVYFYPRDDTQACTAEAITFSLLRTQFGQAQTQVVGISSDSLTSHDKFRRKHALTLDLASDETRTTLEAYGVWREKSMFGNKYMGVERTTVLIDRQGKISRIWRKVRVPGHVEQVLEAACAL